MVNNKLGLSLAALLVLTSYSCDPCRDLSNKICDCKENPEERDVCRKSLSLPASYASFPELRDKSGKQCEEIVNNCSCEDINAGRLNHCGFSRQ